MLFKLDLRHRRTQRFIKKAWIHIKRHELLEFSPKSPVQERRVRFANLQKDRTQWSLNIDFSSLS